MSGHSKWKQIKHKKAAADTARGKLFSKLANAIAIAARAGADPQFNPALRSAIDQARKENMPQANIDRAVLRAEEKGPLEELVLEIYGPGGIGILVEAPTDNRNRTVSEVRALLKQHGAKLAEKGSLLWAFEKTATGYAPKFQAPTPPQTTQPLRALIAALEAHPDIRAVYLTATSTP